MRNASPFHRSPASSPPLRPAGFLARGVAAGLDLLFVLLLYGGAATLTLLLLWAAQPDFTPALLGSWLLALCCYLLTFPLFALAYLLIMHGWQGQTVGKMFLGLRVVTRDGGELSMGLSFLRLVGFGVSLLSCGLGFFWGLVDLRGRTWHDILAATLVVEQ
ncbi:MAG: RDD family protein [Thermodesulfobacteriota bacterium]